jgi:hypothetical protein
VCRLPLFVLLPRVSADKTVKEDLSKVSPHRLMPRSQAYPPRAPNPAGVIGWHVDVYFALGTRLLPVLSTHHVLIASLRVSTSSKRPSFSHSTSPVYKTNASPLHSL